MGLEKMDIAPKNQDINKLQPSEQTDAGNLLQSILAVKKVWQAFMGFEVIFLSSNDRVRALKQHFKAKENVKFPIAYMFETTTMFDSELGLSAKNLARSGTGKGIEIDGNSATITKSFLLPAKMSFDFVVFFDDDYEAIRWKERAILFLASQKLGAVLKHKNFVYDLHQDQPIYEITTPQREPDQVPHPDATEYNLTIGFRTKIGNVRHVAKFNNEGLIGLNLGIMDHDEQVVERIDWGTEENNVRPTHGLSRKDIHSAMRKT